MTCQTCGRHFIAQRSTARYCSSACRARARRTPDNPFPAQLTQRPRWITHDQHKRPCDDHGKLISIHNTNAWMTYEDALKTRRPLGYILGDGIGCIDLDDALHDGTLTGFAQEWIELNPRAYVEVSPSGRGLHIIGLAAPQPGRKTMVNGNKLEIYTTDRFITMTGNSIQTPSALGALSL